jgi:uncharacterized protein
MISKILITGGTGFLGQHLSNIFRKNNFEVSILSRHPDSNKNEFLWDVEKRILDEGAFENVDTIIHLAGANIGTRRWTAKRKKEILDSRVKSAELLFEKLKSGNHSVKTFISPSAVGYYGDRGGEWLDENQPAGKDFLADVCRQWEEAVLKIQSLNIRVVILRMGILLDKDEGALPVMAMPVKFFVGAPVGSGNQYISWIHIDDICNLYLKAVRDENMTGIYNAVATKPVTNREFTKTLAKTMHRPFWNIPVPAFLLKIFLGEKADMVTGGQRVLNEKIMNAGFQLQYPELAAALKNVYGEKIN